MPLALQQMYVCVSFDKVICRRWKITVVVSPLAPATWSSREFVVNLLKLLLLYVSVVGYKLEINFFRESNNIDIIDLDESYEHEC